MTMAIILLHMFWGVVFFDACERQRWWAVAAVVISHLVVSCLVSEVQLHGMRGGSCERSCKDRKCLSSSHADFPESAVRCQPGSHIRHLVPNGHLGVLLCWRLTQEPQTLPHLQRQRLPSCQPPAQITQHARKRVGLSIQRSLSQTL